MSLLCLSWKLSSSFHHRLSSHRKPSHLSSCSPAAESAEHLVELNKIPPNHSKDSNVFQSNCFKAKQFQLWPLIVFSATNFVDHCHKIRTHQLSLFYQESEHKIGTYKDYYTDVFWMSVCKYISWIQHRVKSDSVEVSKMCPLPFTKSPTFSAEWIIIQVWIQRWKREWWIIQQFMAKWIHRVFPRDELCGCVILTVGRSWISFVKFTTCCHQLFSPNFKNCSTPAEVQHSLNECLICAAVSVPVYF